MKFIQTTTLSLILTSVLYSTETKAVEIESAIKPVNLFCNAWQNKNYEEMYNHLSTKHIGMVGKDAVVRQYTQYEKWGVDLVTASVKSAQSNENDVLVKVAVQLSKEIAPNLVTGTYTYHVTNIDDEWKIKTIMAPVAIPVPSGSAGNDHPGM